MTVETQSNKAQYIGNGVAREFPLNFFVKAPEHLRLFRYDGKTQTEMAGGWRVIGAGLAAGRSSVVTDEPVPAGVTLTILRQVPYTQMMDLMNGGGFNPEVVEGAADNLEMQIQQLLELMHRAITAPESMNSGDALYDELIRARDEALETLKRILVILGDISNNRPYFRGDWQPNTPYNQNEIVAGPDGRFWIVTRNYTSSDSFEKDVTAQSLTPYGVEVGPSESNQLRAWVATEKVAAGEVLTLPIAYYPQRSALLFFYNNLPCYPAGVDGEFQYEEVGSDPNVLSWQIRVLGFDILPGDHLMVFQAASAFSAALERAEAWALAAGQSAEEAAEVAQEFEQALIEAQGYAQAAGAFAGDAADSEAIAAGYAQDAEGYKLAAGQSAGEAANSEAVAGTWAVEAQASEEMADQYKLAAKADSEAAGLARAGAEAARDEGLAAAEAARDAAAQAQGILDEMQSLLAGGLDVARLKSVDGSKINVDLLPPQAITDKVAVADEAARFALTADHVQLGDMVVQADNGVTYIVVDLDNLGNEAGYHANSTTTPSVPWSLVTGKPAAFPPTDHAATHRLGGSDMVTPADISAADIVHATRHAAGAADALSPAAIGAAERLHGAAHQTGGADPVDIRLSAVPYQVLAATLAAGANFTVPEYTVGQMDLEIFCNSLICTPGLHFSEVGTVGAKSTIIRFTDALAAGAEIDIRRIA